MQQSRVPQATAVAQEAQSEAVTADLFNSVRHAASAVFNQRTRDLTKIEDLKMQAQQMAEEVTVIQSLHAEISAHSATIEAISEEAQQQAASRTAALKEVNASIGQITQDQQLCSRMFKNAQPVANLVNCFVSEVCTPNATSPFSLFALMERGRALTCRRSAVEFRQLSAELKRSTAVTRDFTQQMCQTGIYNCRLLESCREWDRGGWRSHTELVKVRQKLEALSGLGVYLSEAYAAALANDSNAPKAPRKFTADHAVSSIVDCCVARGLPSLPETELEVQFFHKDVHKLYHYFAEETDAAAFVGGAVAPSLLLLAPAPSTDVSTAPELSMPPDGSPLVTVTDTAACTTPAQLFAICAQRTQAANELLSRVHAKCGRWHVSVDPDFFPQLQSVADGERSALVADLQCWMVSVRQLHQERSECVACQLLNTQERDSEVLLEEEVVTATAAAQQSVEHEADLWAELEGLAQRWSDVGSEAAEQERLRRSLTDDSAALEAELQHVAAAVSALQAEKELLAAPDPAAATAAAELEAIRTAAAAAEAERCAAVAEETTAEGLAVEVEALQQQLHEAMADLLVAPPISPTQSSSSPESPTATTEAEDPLAPWRHRLAALTAQEESEVHGTEANDSASVSCLVSFSPLREKVIDRLEGPVADGPDTRTVCTQLFHYLTALGSDAQNPGQDGDSQPPSQQVVPDGGTGPESPGSKTASGGKEEECCTAFVEQAKHSMWHTLPEDLLVEAFCAVVSDEAIAAASAKKIQTHLEEVNTELIFRKAELATAFMLLLYITGLLLLLLSACYSLLTFFRSPKEEGIDTSSRCCRGGAHHSVEMRRSETFPMHCILLGSLVPHHLSLFLSFLPMNGTSNRGDGVLGSNPFLSQRLMFSLFTMKRYFPGTEFSRRSWRFARRVVGLLLRLLWYTLLVLVLVRFIDELCFHHGEEENYYAILGVSWAVPPREVAKAYRRKALALHPDAVYHSTIDKETLQRQFMLIKDAKMVLIAYSIIFIRLLRRPFNTVRRWAWTYQFYFDPILSHCFVKFVFNFTAHMQQENIGTPTTQQCECIVVDMRSAFPQHFSLMFMNIFGSVNRHQPFPLSIFNHLKFCLTPNSLLKFTFHFRLLLLAAVVLVLFAHHFPVGAFGPRAPKEDDLYKELGVTRHATKAEVKKAFRKLSMEHHPDLKETAEEKEEAKEKMLKILHAYEILSDEEQRRMYDEKGYVGQRIPELNEFSSLEELYQFFHQSMPLVSKSRTLESLTELERIMHFQGPKVFLVQVYSDANSNSRDFADSWETLYTSSLVRSGVVEMYRIDSDSPEGSKLIKKLGITLWSSSHPPVFAVVDGERWAFTHSKSVATRLIADELTEFLLKFFYEVLNAGTEEEIRSDEDLLAYVQRPLAHGKKGRLLLHRMDTESIADTLKIRYNELEVSVVERDILLRFVHRCGGEVTATDRFGDKVITPDFMIAIRGPLSGEDPSADGTSSDAADGQPDLNCGNVEIGVSSYMTYDRAAKFAEELRGVPHPEMVPIPHMDAFTFFEVCREDCLLYVRPTCDESPAPSSVVHLLKRNYRKVRTGYLCLDEHPALLEAVDGTALDAGVDPTIPFLAALIGSDDKNVYPIFSEGGNQDPSGIVPEDVDQALGKLLASKLDDEDSILLPFFTLASGIATLLLSAGFPLSSNQRYALMSSVFLDSLRPYASTTMPFIIMYIVHRFVLNRNKAPVKPVNKLGKKMGAIFDEDDLDDAKESKGFLILVADRRPPASGPLTLPPMANDTRFTVRVLGMEHRRWKKWIQKNEPKPPATEDEKEEGEPAAPKELQEDAQLGILAIRGTRMTGAIKPQTQSVDSFLRDLLDGTCNPALSSLSQSQVPMFPFAPNFLVLLLSIVRFGSCAYMNKRINLTTKTQKDNIHLLKSSPEFRYCISAKGVVQLSLSVALSPTPLSIISLLLCTSLKRIIKHPGFSLNILYLAVSIDLQEKSVHQKGKRRSFDTNMSSNGDIASAQVVYGALHAAQQTRPDSHTPVPPLPAFQLYRLAREEELLAYRSLCRVFGMHYGPSSGSFPKEARRILEDIRESWCIPAERAALEEEMTTADGVVQGIHRSGVLRRREDFFDGVVDVDIQAPSASGTNIEDDDTLQMLPGKRPRVEYPAGTASEAPRDHRPLPSAAGSARRKNAIQAQLARIRSEVKVAAKNYLVSLDPNTQQEARETLQARQAELLQIQAELDMDPLH
eukprot:gene7383-5197_t